MRCDMGAEFRPAHSRSQKRLRACYCVYNIQTDIENSANAQARKSASAQARKRSTPPNPECVNEMVPHILGGRGDCCVFDVWEFVY